MTAWFRVWTHLHRQLPPLVERERRARAEKGWERHTRGSWDELPVQYWKQTLTCRSHLFPTRVKLTVIRCSWSIHLIRTFAVGSNRTSTALYYKRCYYSHSRFVRDCAWLYGRWSFSVRFFRCRWPLKLKFNSWTLETSSPLDHHRISIVIRLKFNQHQYCRGHAIVCAHRMRLCATPSNCPSRQLQNARCFACVFAPTKIITEWTSKPIGVTVSEPSVRFRLDWGRNPIELRVSAPWCWRP